MQQNILYLTDKNGNLKAVQISVDLWNQLKPLLPKEPEIQLLQGNQLETTWKHLSNLYNTGISTLPVFLLLLNAQNAILQLLTGAMILKSFCFGQCQFLEVCWFFTV